MKAEPLFTLLSAIYCTRIYLHYNIWVEFTLSLEEVFIICYGDTAVN